MQKQEKTLENKNVISDGHLDDDEIVGGTFFSDAKLRELFDLVRHRTGKIDVESFDVLCSMTSTTLAHSIAPSSCSCSKASATAKNKQQSRLKKL